MVFAALSAEFGQHCRSCWFSAGGAESLSPSALQSTELQTRCKGLPAGEMHCLTCFKRSVLWPGEFEELENGKELGDLGNTLLLTEESHLMFPYDFSVMKYCSFMPVESAFLPPCDVTRKIICCLRGKLCFVYSKLLLICLYSQKHKHINNIKN